MTFAVAAVGRHNLNSKCLSTIIIYLPGFLLENPWKTHGFRPDVPRCYGKPVFKTQDSEELSKPRPEHAAVAALTAKARSPVLAVGFRWRASYLPTHWIGDDRTLMWNDFAKHVEKIKKFF